MLSFGNLNPLTPIKCLHNSGWAGCEAEGGPTLSAGQGASHCGTWASHSPPEPHFAHLVEGDGDGRGWSQGGLCIV